MDPAILLTMISGVVGGLGIFLLGMKNMSEGMQAVAGPSLRKMIGAVTNNRLLATGVGTIVTCIVQSSSITTVMVVGFVNSGVMQLSQAVGVIMGANIGTTITGWILVLKIGKYGLPLLGVAAFVYLFSRGDRWRYWAMALMGIGMVFFGLELMKDACSHVEDLPQFKEWFQQFNADSYLGVLGCAFIGCMLTVLVQSSSATLGITISLAFEGVITYETAAALVLGENIGTTITAYLASLGATTNARRAAYFHIIFNLVGVFWITLVFHWYVQFIQWMFEGIVQQPEAVNGETVFPHTTAAIAATHSIFNVVNTLLFLPFLPLFVRLLVKIVPPKAHKEKPHLTGLDIRMLETPLLAIEQSRREVLRMGDNCRKMLDWLRELLPQAEHDRKLADRMHRREETLDRMHDEVAQFVTQLLSGSVPHEVAVLARQQLRMAHEYETIGDYVETLLKYDQRLRKEGLRFTEKQTVELLVLHDKVVEYLRMVDKANAAQDRDVIGRIGVFRKAIRSEIKRLRKEHLEELSGGEVPPNVSVAFMATLNGYSRVRDHTQNIAESLAGE